MSFCSCNKKVCRESYSWTALLAADPLCLCWSTGAQHQGPCVLSSVFSSGHPQSTDVLKVLLSSLPLVSLLPADSGQQAELGQSLEFQPRPPGLC